VRAPATLPPPPPLRLRHVQPARPATLQCHAVERHRRRRRRRRA